MLGPLEAALRDATRLLGALALPVLLAILGAGLLAALLMGVTKLRDRSISVVPRIVSVGLAVTLLGGWCASRLGVFATQMFHAAEVTGHESATSPPK